MNKYETYYPRPLLKRDSFFSLNGRWKLNQKDIEIPFPPESQLSGYRRDFGELNYQKAFSLPDDFARDDDKVVLHFGAVDQICDVFLNDQFLLHHEGGYLPFSIDITAYLKDENELTVQAKDELDLFYPYGKQSKDPKGMWYTPVSGIWQSVWIEAYDQKGIDDLKIESFSDHVVLHIDSQSDSFTIAFEGSRKTYHEKDIRIDIPKAHLWDIEDPYLYHFTISTQKDEVSSYFALKDVQVRKVNGYQRFYLNGRPVFINGLLDQGYFKKGIFLPEGPEGYEEDILNIKGLGFNCLRKHIKIELEAFYYYCDLHGILIIQDMVNSGPYRFFRDTILPTIGFTKIRCPIEDQKRYEFFLDHAEKTIRHLNSHPSIIGYTIYNEGWGQQDASKTYQVLKALDPQRLFDSTSGWFFDDESDFDSYHIYFRNKVLKGKERLLLLSECGGFIREIEGHQNKEGSRWGYGQASSEEGLTDKILEMHEKMLIPSIENGLCGAIMTQISDVEGEINGLFTYDRQVCKVNKEKLLKANQRLQELYKERSE